MPTGKIKFYDNDKGFGFISGDDGAQVFLGASALPAGMTTVKAGIRVEYGVADGRKGPSALQVKLLSAPAVTARGNRKPAEEMIVIIEDVIRLLDANSESLRRGHYPDRKTAQKTAQLLRAVASDLEV